MPVRTLGSLHGPPLVDPCRRGWSTSRNVRATQLRDDAGGNVAAGAARGRRARVPTDHDATPSPSSGELDAARYGDLLAARGLVGVRGAGFSTTASTTSSASPTRSPAARYKQTFSLDARGPRLDHDGAGV